MRKTSDIIWQDAQHQVLFETLDLIREPDSGTEVWRNLQEYTENHFALEERYMELLSFPGRVAHTASHDRFRRELDELVAAGGAQDALFRELVGTFLTQWLTRHVFGIDKDLEAFLLAEGVR